MATPYLREIGINTKIVPHGHWSEINNNGQFINRISFIERMGRYLGYTSMKDWYNISKKDTDEFGGSGLLVKYYNGSIIGLIQETYPNYWFIPWKFKNSPQGYWNSIDNAWLWLDVYGEREGLKKVESLYCLRKDDFIKHDGVGLFTKYGCTIIRLLRTIYPNIPWNPFNFPITVMGSLKDVENHYMFFDSLEQKLGITRPEEWYHKLSKNTIIEHKGGAGLLSNYYQNSPIRFLKCMRSTASWKWYKFTQAAHGSWDDKNCVREWFEDMCKHYGFSSMEDVYSVRCSQIIDFYGNGGIDRYQGYINLIVKNIEYPWDKIKFRTFGFSKIATEFMKNLAIAIDTDVQHVKSSEDGEKRIDGTRFHADGFIKEYNHKQNIVIEFHGCYYHGCPQCLPQRDDLQHSKSSSTNEMLYSKTSDRTERIRKIGYNVVEVWECEAERIVNLKDWFDKKIQLCKNESIHPRP